VTYDIKLLVKFCPLLTELHTTFLDLTGCMFGLGLHDLRGERSSIV
jgi:hypothetical protein